VQHALRYSHILPGEEVMDIQIGSPIQISTNRRRIKTRAVLLATGARTRHLGVPGEKELSGRGVSYCSTCDGPLFAGKRVLMVGGGDSAVTEALHLDNIGVEVTLIHRRERLRAQAHLLESLKRSGVEVLYHTELKRILGRDRVRQVELVNNQTGQSQTRDMEGVFIAVGYEPSVDLAQKLGVEIGPKGYILKDDRHRTSVPGIYSAGDVEGGYKQIVIAAGQGAEAAMAIFEDLVNPYWLEKRKVGEGE
jgi:thioredoxin reductase (NADPH)